MKNMVRHVEKINVGLEQNKNSNKHALLSKKFFPYLCLLGIIIFSLSFFVEAYNTQCISPVYRSQHLRSANIMPSIRSASTSNSVGFNQYSLNFSTYFGGTGDDGGASIAVDNNGNTYITGSTASSDLPVKNAFQSTLKAVDNVYVAKFNATGGLVFSTYFGGSNGENGTSIAVDNNGNSYITGLTTSSNFPLKNAYQSTLKGFSDAFVAKFNATGGLVFSTYFGGNNSEAGDAIAADSYGNSYIIGQTGSTNLPLKNAFQSIYGNLFIAKFNSTGSLEFSTYFGGVNGDHGNGIAVDSNGNSYITGQSYSTNLTTKNAYQAISGGNGDAFVAKFNTTGGLMFSTYFGGNSYDSGNGITVDSNGNTYITGLTTSTNFPIKNAFQSTLNGLGYNDAFVAKFNTTGGLMFSTYFGGSNNDRGIGIAIENNAIYISGYTSSSDFPLKNAYQTTYAPNASAVSDIFLAIINATGNGLISSTYYGYNNLFLGGIAVDVYANIYISGTIQSNGLIPLKNAFQATFNGGTIGDAFITKFTPPGTAGQNYLYGYWKMDDSSGPVLDSSGFGRNGIAFGGIMRGQPGIFGSSYAFNGINSYVGIGNMSQSSSLQTPISLSLWFKTNITRFMELFSQSAYVTTSSLNSFYNDSRGINVMANGSMEFYSRDANSMFKSYSAEPYPLNNNVWHFIVLVQNNSLVCGYIDSILVFQLNIGSYLTSYTNYFTLGRGTNTTSYFQGNIDDVRVYTTALTSTNITALYQQSSLPIPTPKNTSSLTNTLTITSPGFTLTPVLIIGSTCYTGVAIWRRKDKKMN